MPKGRKDKLMATIKYGNFEIDMDKLPAASVDAMFRRGVSHFFGSEQASKVTAYFDPAHDDAKNRPDTPENRAAKKAEFQKAAYDALLAGTVGVSVRGPTVDPITTIVHRLAKAEIKGILAHNKLKWPAKADATVKLANGETVTGEQLIARRLDPTGPAGIDTAGKFGPKGMSHLERLTKEANKIAAEQSKKNAKLAEQAEGADL